MKNVIFDIGNVLVDFCWEPVFRNLGLEGADFEAVANATVRSSAWNESDRGVWTDEEVMESFLKQAPDQEANIRMIWDHVGNMVRCYPYTREWIRDLKEQGYHCYALSNYPERIFERTKEELSFLDEMDGAILSYQVKMVKPDPGIYLALLNKYGLKADECIFFDDKLENVLGAQRLGIHGVQFLNRDQAMKEIMRWRI